ncbi:MAG: response regulator transcription factor [Eggerthellaceae bacterium]
MPNVLVIEDDSDIAELERDYLQAAGFDVTVAHDGPAGLDAALARPFDVVILDVMLPGMDGFEVCRRLRHASDVPVLMVTARTEDADAVLGLGLGADDYITKPFSPRVLVAKAQAQLRRTQRAREAVTERLASARSASAGSVLQASGVRLDAPAHRVTVRGVEVELPNLEFELLRFLMENQGLVLSKATIYERVWGQPAYGDLPTVAVHVNRLREKIEANPAHPQIIQTVRGAGYRFAAGE